MSNKWQLNLTDLKNLARAALIYIAPSLITLLTTVQDWQVLTIALIKSMCLSIAIDLLRRLLQDNTK